MKAYIYDSENYFIGETLLQASPLEPGVYFEMASTTKITPPVLETNQVARWDGSKWSVIPDYSGKKYYSKSDKSEKSFAKGEAFDANYTELAPLENEVFQKFENDKWVIDEEAKKENELKIRQSKIQALLLATDYIELPSFLERKGQSAYDAMMKYRSELRKAYHDSSLPIPEVPNL